MCFLFKSFKSHTPQLIKKLILFDNHNKCSTKMVSHHNHIHRLNHIFYKEKTQDEYYIGSAVKEEDQYLLCVAISPNCFFSFEFKHIKKYLNSWSWGWAHTCFEIMKMHIVDWEYRVVLKTHWLRLVQRHWKKTFSQREIMKRTRGSLHSLKHFEIHGKWTPKNKVLPSLFGIMSVYSKKTS